MSHYNSLWREDHGVSESASSGGVVSGQVRQGFQQKSDSIWCWSECVMLGVKDTSKASYLHKYRKTEERLGLGVRRKS